MRTIIFLLIIALLGSCDFCNEEDRIDKEFYANGHIKQEIFYSCGKSYYRKAYFEEQEGQLRIEQYLKNGVPHGEKRVYWDNGNLQGLIFFEDGLKHGEFKIYSKDGTPIDTLYFVKDKEVGR